MFNSKTKFLAELILLIILSFLTFISCVKGNLIFDTDGLIISTMLIFVLSVDVSIYVFRNYYKQESIKINKKN